MFDMPLSYSAKTVQGLYEVLHTFNLNGARCHVIYDGKATRAAVIEAKSSVKGGEMRHQVLAVLEMERVARINTTLRIKSFWADPDGEQSECGVVEPDRLAKALYETLTARKRITLVGL
ncbi:MULTISPECIES: hypothetical protein [Pantoea]|uniref:hypothetical protein n=1 Tax=Pantoea TaxID=53335 RepID=UPI0002584F89|nr:MULTISPECIES: hypothetical protein [Pantoea]KAF6660538.1 hypothetical protein HFD91_10960 [Enterobacteriaceae bacterium EKM102V]TPE14535.1 hypothetical protein FJP62_12325 [Pantoea vagans]EIB96675.1 hypothetical protein S7A_18859 [Pantoea sp. Sc1]KAF6669623.1 hypothetical protein HFD97_07050 [Pantoea sp. EKM103V]KKB02937.1 hypothetical protein TN98_18170 [Pantoea anthophila]